MGIMSFVLGVSNTLGRLADSFQQAIDEKDVSTSYQGIVPILNLMDSALIPILIVLVAAGTIYSVVLGVNMARADSSEKREEAKKRLINFLIGIVIVIVLIAIMYVLAAQLPNILAGVENVATEEGGNP